MTSSDSLEILIPFKGLSGLAGLLKEDNLSFIGLKEANPYFIGTIRLVCKTQNSVRKTHLTTIVKSSKPP